jgi:CRISPR/Cas system-associated exonuclease Cas4 (RecB family)
MAKIDIGNSAVDFIYSLQAKKRENRRSYGIGCSTLGDKCDRKIWYNFRWAGKPKEFDERMLRLLETGQREEERIIAELKQHPDYEIVDKIDDKQIRVGHFGGHVSGYLDGMIKGLKEAPKTWHLLEIKTSNDKRFKELQKRGVKAARFEHFAQMQMYMGLEKVTRALYLCVNKNDDCLYAERVEFDKQVFQDLLDRAERIITSDHPPERISNNPEGWDCKYCDFNSYCHQRVIGEIIAPNKNCRTCAHSTPQPEDGSWQCGKKLVTLTKEEQEKGCEKHVFLPPLVELDVEDVEDDETVIYTDPKTGDMIYNHPGQGLSRIPF